MPVATKETNKQLELPTEFTKTNTSKRELVGETSSSNPLLPPAHTVGIVGHVTDLKTIKVFETAYKQF